jgi:flavin-dependent dehydrogenase
MSDLDPSIEHVDVLVVGGGPVGISYSSVCAQTRL